jgi:hypothetical protein
MDTTLAARIMSRSIPEPNSGCWLWLGNVQESGHGRLKVGGRTTPAHRASWTAFNGHPGKLFVCHRCDVPSCVNPGHLFLGTCADNHADRDAKGRQARGERGGRALITASQASFIHRSDYPARYLQAVFGISKSQVKRIKDGESWSHLFDGTIVHAERER